MLSLPMKQKHWLEIRRQLSNVLTMAHTVHGQACISVRHNPSCFSFFSVDTSGVPAPAAEVSVGEHVEEVSPAEEGSPASSGVSSLGSSWTSSQNLTVEAEALLQLSNQESDEGIVSDQSSSADSEGVEGAKRIRVSRK